MPKIIRNSPQNLEVPHSKDVWAMGTLAALHEVWESENAQYLCKAGSCLSQVPELPSPLSAAGSSGPTSKNVSVPFLKFS